MTVFNIERAFNEKKRKGWEKLYWSIDFHDVIVKGTYTRFNDGKEFYPFAHEVLKNLCNRRERLDDTRLILWSPMHEDAMREVDRWLIRNNIIFDFVNANPECGNTELCDFSKKFYFNILLEDKAGFEGEKDWQLIKSELIRIGEWDGTKL
jgi:hypothetical protein